MMRAAVRLAWVTWASVLALAPACGGGDEEPEPSVPDAGNGGRTIDGDARASAYPAAFVSTGGSSSAGTQRSQRFPELLAIEDTQALDGWTGSDEPARPELAGCDYEQKLAWDFERDGRIDGEERRFFAANGQLIAAWTLDADGLVASRTEVTYDPRDRVTAIRYARSCPAAEIPCDAQGGVQHTTLVRVDYAEAGAASVELSTDEGPLVMRVCETMELDAEGRLLSRTHGMCGEDDPRSVFVLAQGSMGIESYRHMLADGEDSHELASVSWSYEDLDDGLLVKAIWEGIDFIGHPYRIGTSFELWRRFAHDGRLLAIELDVHRDGIVDAYTDYRYEGDWLLREETDLDNDGIVDLLWTREPDGQGRLRLETRRNLTPPGYVLRGDPLAPFNAADVEGGFLMVPPASVQTVNYHYSDDGLEGTRTTDGPLEHVDESLAYDASGRIIAWSIERTPAAGVAGVLPALVTTCSWLFGCDEMPGSGDLNQRCNPRPPVHHDVFPLGAIPKPRLTRTGSETEPFPPEPRESDLVDYPWY